LKGPVMPGEAEEAAEAGAPLALTLALSQGERGLETTFWTEQRNW
jgi:hypothetical protein